MNQRLRMNTAQAAEHAGCHVNTVQRALEVGDLHGDQRKPRGRWSIRTECLESWIEGAKCSHQQGVAA